MVMEMRTVGVYRSENVLALHLSRETLPTAAIFISHMISKMTYHRQLYNAKHNDLEGGQVLPPAFSHNKYIQCLIRNTSSSPKSKNFKDWLL